jgi:Zn-dependent protease
VDLTTLIGFGLRFLLILPAIILHEVAHGYAAYLLGDPTAKSRGRLSLNPIVHIDPFGTLLLPAILLLGSGGHVAFGYAKPVPINPHNFKNYQTGMLLTGVAGPCANLLMAIVAGLIVRVIGVDGIVGVVLYGFATINLLLMFFNLIPIPPLDGSRVIQWFLHGEALRAYDSIERYGFIVLFGILFLAPGVFNQYLAVTVDPLLRLITGLG